MSINIPESNFITRTIKILLYDQRAFESELMIVNNSLLFYGTMEDGQGYKLIKSDGTRAGTVILKDSYTPTFSSNPDQFANLNGIVYFRTNYQAENWNYNEYVYRTNGTTAGTSVVKTFQHVGSIEVAEDNIFFTGQKPQIYDAGAWQLWKTNGKATGTVLLKEFGAAWDNVPQLSNASVNGTVFFHTRKGELWKSNGTIGGTVVVKKFSEIRSVVSSGSIVFVLVVNSAGGYEIWRSNGTAVGTVKLQSSPNVLSLYPNSTLNGIFYFVGYDPIHDYELWRSDGTVSGTYLVTDLRVNDFSEDDIFSMNVFKNSLYVSAMGDENQYALYKTDGTHAGTHKLANVAPIVQNIPNGDHFLFFPRDYTWGASSVLWRSDGTVEGTRSVKTIDDGSNFDGIHFEVINNIVYFTTGPNCCDMINGGNLWRTDGTECGTFAVPTGLAKVSPLESIGDNLILGGFQNLLYGKELYRLNVSNAAESPCGIPMLTTARTSTENLMSAQEEGTGSPYPNPFKQDFSFRVNGSDHELVNVDVFTSTGYPVEKFTELKANTDYQLGSGWAPGLYILSIKTSGKTIPQKVWKK